MTTAASPSDAGAVRSLIPFRMDRLPWARFHWMVVLGLGTAWILDGLEIQLVASAGFQDTLHMSSTQVGLTGTIYLIGQVVGALFFGRLTDKLGRKRLSSSPWRSTSSAPAWPGWRGTCGGCGSGASWPDWGSAGSTPRSTPRSTS